MYQRVSAATHPNLKRLRDASDRPYLGHLGIFMYVLGNFSESVYVWGTHLRNPKYSSEFAQLLHDFAYLCTPMQAQVWARREELLFGQLRGICGSCKSVQASGKKILQKVHHFCANFPSNQSVSVTFYPRKTGARCT